MKPEELEAIFIRSLDAPLSTKELDEFLAALKQHPLLAKELEEHNSIREILKAKEPATFGPYFASKLMTKIQNTGVVIDRQLFSFFKKFQLAAMGVVVALLVLDVVFANENCLIAVL